MDTEQLIKMLRDAGTDEERLAAVRTAISQGHSLRELEELLDWLENLLEIEIPPPDSERAE